MNFNELNTLFNHQPEINLEEDNNPLVAPLYKSSKYTMPYTKVKKVFDGSASGFLYSRVANPTVRNLEKILATATNKEEGICYASGLNALFSVMITNLAKDDHVIAFIESYKPTRMILKETLKRFGVTCSFISIDKVHELSKHKKEKTKMILFESITNPQLRVADLDAIITFAKENNIISIYDNTYGGFHQGNEVDSDYLIHSLTKYASGHSDMTGGIALGSREMILRLRMESFKLGGALAPEQAYSALQGLKTYSLRYQRQVENTLSVGEFLIKKEVKNLSFLGSPNHPDTKNIKKYLKDNGTILYFDAPVKNENEFENFFKRLKLFKLTGSLGACESLIAPANLFYSGDLSDEESNLAKINPFSVRLSIGIEDFKDLISDLENALNI